MTNIVEVPVIKKALHIGRINPKGPKKKFLIVEILAEYPWKRPVFLFRCFLCARSEKNMVTDIVEVQAVLRIQMFIPDPTFFHPGSEFFPFLIPDPHQII